MRLIGVLLPAGADDTVFQARMAAFHQGLALSGWTIGRSVRIDTRWATTDAAEICRHAAELAALAPDVILAHAATTVGPLLQVALLVKICAWARCVCRHMIERCSGSMLFASRPL